MDYTNDVIIKLTKYNDNVYKKHKIQTNKHVPPAKEGMSEICSHKTE